MKNLFYSFFITILFMSSSCSSNNEYDNNDNLNNTIWERDNKSDTDPDKKIEVRLELQEKTFILYYDEVKYNPDSNESIDREMFEGTFSYNGSHLVLSFKDYNGEQKTLMFTVYKDYISNDKYGNLNRK